MTPIEMIKKLYTSDGLKDYIGEKVSQLEHALQCGDLAIKAGADDETVLAAFLHDIGHFSPESSDDRMSKYGRVNHENVGGDYLRELGFSEKICSLVSLHVAAKRYLVSTTEKYFDRLTPASRKTLEFQGGPMDADEVREFEKGPLYKEALRIRAWDEEGKVVGTPTRSLKFYLELMEKHLSH